MPNVGDRTVKSGVPYIYTGYGTWEPDKNLQGDSAYQVWLDEGNTGSEQDFIDYLSANVSTESIANAITSVSSATPNDADEFTFVQSVGGLLKKINWINIKSLISAFIQSVVDYIKFDTTPADATSEEGKLVWNATDGTLDLGHSGGVTQQIGHELYKMVKNQSGADISNGQPVMFAGAVGASGRTKGRLAIADGTYPASYIIGLATQDIDNGDEGRVTTFGKVRGINTTGGTETWVQGDLIYVSDTIAGGLTNVAPEAPSLQIIIGIASYISATNGEIEIHPSYSCKLSDLDDVDGTALTETGQIPVWNDTEGYFDFTEVYGKFGDVSGGNYSEFESDGTLKANGDATCFRDELNDLVKAAANNPASHLVFDFVEGTLDFETGCDLDDYALMNVQINHDWKLGSDVEPHVHWFQNQNATPNWLIQYRWQRQASAKTTAWTSVKWSANAEAYTTGTINQITSFGAITPPVGYGQVSDILQIRLIRDVANTSTLFTGADAYTGDAEAVSFDVHIEVDTLGSRQLYVK